VDVRIGVTYTAKEVEVELDDDADHQQLIKDVETALGDEDRVLWLTDKRGRRFGVPGAKIAYVEIGSPNEDRRVGFASH
jgi:hypothetical protein